MFMLFGSIKKRVLKEKLICQFGTYATKLFEKAVDARFGMKKYYKVPENDV